jgi:hypothetical protein
MKGVFLRQSKMQIPTTFEKKTILLKSLQFSKSIDVETLTWATKFFFGCNLSLFRVSKTRALLRAGETQMLE